MAKFVAITKTHIEAKRDPLMPDEWPAECEEFETYEEAVKKYPELNAKGRILTGEQYSHFAKVLAIAYPHLPKKLGFLKRMSKRGYKS